MCYNRIRTWNLPAKVVSNCILTRTEGQAICTVAEELIFSNSAKKS